MYKYNKILNVISLATVGIQVLLIGFYMYKLPKYILYIDLICVIIYCGISCNNFRLCKKLDKFKTKATSLGKYNNSLKKANDDIRTFRHDFNNIMQAVGGYIKLNDFDGLKEYYRDLVSECASLKTVATITPNTINDCKMYNIVMEKSELARKENIAFEFISMVDFSKLEGLNCNIAEIIQHMLDVAIDAVKDSNKKWIIFDCVYEQKKRKYVIVATAYGDCLKKYDNTLCEQILKSIEKKKILKLKVDLIENVLMQELDINL